MKAPIINIEKDSMDWMLEVIALIALLVLIGLPIFFYNELPDTIPIHFDIKGQPDGFGDKKMIWLLPGIGVFVYSLLTFINNHPNTFNYSVKITEENALDQYKIATKMIRWLNVIILIFFAIIIYEIIQLGLGHPSNIGKIMIPIFVCSIFGMIGYSFYQSKSKK